MTDLYKNIKNRRNELRMTQSELAQKVGYADKGMISRVENGKVDLSQSQILKFAEALETDPATLMGWTDHITAANPYDYKDMSNLIVYENGSHPTTRDREEALAECAKKLYEFYRKASPEIQEAVDLLLKTDKQ